VILISHRGNLNGPDPETENNPNQIDKALQLGYNVEIDVWFVNDEFWLGHDGPKYLVTKKYLQNNKLWCHAKNLAALQRMAELSNVRFFWHQNDDYTLTSDGFIWAHPDRQLSRNSICVMPEKQKTTIQPEDCAGICSDYIIKYLGENCENSTLF